MGDKKPYQKDRLIARHSEGFVTITPQNASASVPLCCDLCDYMLCNRDDEVAFLEFNCCHRCALKWAHPRRELWKNGWRPSQEDRIEFNSDRQRVLITFDID